MIKIERNTFRRALNSKMSELGRGNRNREALTLETSPDELDRIQHAHDRDYAIGNLERNSARLREVRTALGRINAGNIWNLRRVRREHQFEAPGRSAVGSVVHRLPGSARSWAGNAQPDRTHPAEQRGLPTRVRRASNFRRKRAHLMSTGENYALDDCCDTFHSFGFLDLPLALAGA